MSPPRNVLPLLGLLLLMLGVGSPLTRGELPHALAEEEQDRVAVIKQVSRSTIALFEPSGESGGSGVLISEEGYALTNFHVTAPCGPWITVGTSDGKTHDAVLVGIDPCGDIALVQLLGDGPFPAARIGDSEQVEVGDEAIVVGNPFLLADDYVPSLSFGIISGTHRYQPPSGSLLEYTDCLQTDAAINPGNSGGPLFNRQGQLIGINGRGSFEKRGRVSVGVGYAVSINQVMRFLPQLKSGRILDHASLGATVRTERGPEPGESHAIVDAIRSDSDAYRRGLRAGDELLLFGKQEIHTANELLNAVGVCPPGWRVPIRFRSGAQLREATVRLEPLHSSSELREAVASMTPRSPDKEAAKGDDDAPSAKRYEAAPGFANRFYNRLETKRVLQGWRHREATVRLPNHMHWVDRKSNQQAVLRFEPGSVRWESSRGRFRLDTDRAFDHQRVPPPMPGLLAGAWIWHQLAERTETQLEEIEYVGQLLWTAESSPCDVLRIRHQGVIADTYHATDDGRLVGWEVWLDAAEDPTRVSLSYAETHLEQATLPEIAAVPPSWMPTQWSIEQGETQVDLALVGIGSLDGASP